MSSKTVTVVVVVVLVLLGIYFFTNERMEKSEVMHVENKSNSTVVQNSADVSAAVPGKTSSSDEIVDYLVDGLSADAKTTAEASITNSSAPSQADAGSSLNTNF